MGVVDVPRMVDPFPWDCTPYQCSGIRTSTRFSVPRKGQPQRTRNRRKRIRYAEPRRDCISQWSAERHRARLATALEGTLIGSGRPCRLSAAG